MEYILNERDKHTSLSTKPGRGKSRCYQELLTCRYLKAGKSAVCQNLRAGCEPVAVLAILHEQCKYLLSLTAGIRICNGLHGSKEVERDTLLSQQYNFMYGSPKRMYFYPAVLGD